MIDQTSWSITAVGPAATSARLFGSRPTANAPRAAVTGALPRVPLQLQSSVAAVFPTTGGPAAFHHATSTLDGSAFRNAYTPAHVAPPTGKNDGKATVATLQLANFYGPTLGNFSNSARAADLTKYAKLHKISDPVASHRYTAVKVDGGPRAMDDDAGGSSPDVEVALDQQSILSTAPSAHQQAYFAPNTDAGYNDVFAHVYDDVTGNGPATHKNPNIVAMSVSWGGCETDTGRKSIMTLEPILKSLVAAGVTVFASAGDAGIYDCSSTPQASVDYPGSSPSVVSVGGTHLSAGANRPNTGNNWSETAWSCSGTYSCYSPAGRAVAGRTRSPPRSTSAPASTTRRSAATPAGSSRTSRPTPRRARAFASTPPTRACTTSTSASAAPRPSAAPACPRRCPRRR